MNKKKIKDYFAKKDTVYNWWDPLNSERGDIYARQEKIIEKKLKERKINSLLDVSCGRGRFAQRLTKKIDNYTCLDISKQMLNHIKKLNLGVKLIQRDIETCNLNKKYDVIICAEAIVHYSNPLKALKNMKDHLKKEGILIVTTDNSRCLGKRIRLIENYFLNKKGEKTYPIGNEIYKPYTEKEYLDFFNKAKLNVDSKRKISIFSTPIKLKSSNFYIISPFFSKLFYYPDMFFEKIPFLNRLSTYFIYFLTK